MPLSQKEKRLIIGNTLLILAVVVFRAWIVQRPGHHVYHGFLSMAYLALYLEWLLSIRRRFLQKDMRKHLRFAAVLMIYWIILRFIKYDIVPGDALLGRYIWYSYYIPIILIPLQFFLSTLYVGKTDRSDISRKWLYLYIPAGIIMGGILTNDLHQRAFRFRLGFDGWNVDYTHGPFYFAAVWMIVGCMTGILVIVFRTCIRHHFLKYCLLPLADLGIGVLYFYLYTNLSEEKSVLQMGLELPEFTCLMLIGFWECLVFTRLIPSNRNHEVFFQAASIHAGLTDTSFTVQMSASTGITPSPEEIRASVEAPFLMEGGNTLLKACPVSGGIFYWMEDISQLNRLNRELEETADYLSEEHAVLEETTKLEESRKRTAQQSRLYDQITKSIQEQLQEVEEILNHLPEEEETFRKVFEYAGILGAYIKRRSNLLLLAGGGEEISSGELSLSVRESLEYVKLLDIPCRSDMEDGHVLSAGLALFLYELFEEILEASLPDADGVLVSLKVMSGLLIFYMETGSPTDQPNIRRFEKAVRRLGGKLVAEYADGAESITFTMDHAQSGEAKEGAIMTKS